jgi:hypothetical protein
LSKVYPWACCCCNWPRENKESDKKDGNQEGLMDGQDKKDDTYFSAKKENKPPGIDENPILTYGFGIDIYLGITYQLILLFSLFSLMVIPMFMFYNAQEAYHYREE